MVFGNILNNAQIKNLRSSKELTLSPFVEQRLRLAHYALTPAGIIWAGDKNSKGNRELKARHDFSSNEEYVFQPNEYAIVEVAEFILLPDGIVGHFLPSSSLVERGFGLTAGKLDPKYGFIANKRQKLIFGLKNLRNEPNTFSSAEGFAHIYFIDLRGLNSHPFDFSDPEVSDLIKRVVRFNKARDDGPRYE